MLLVGLFLADGEHQLGEERREVGTDARFRLRPEERFRFPERRAVLLRGHAEIHRAENARAVERAKNVVGDLVLDFLFVQFRAVGHLSFLVSRAAETEEPAIKSAPFLLVSYSPRGALQEPGTE